MPGGLCELNEFPSPILGIPTEIGKGTPSVTNHKTQFWLV
jgi:hypothetical protein